MLSRLDLDAPIVPGRSAGGCQIGQSIESLFALEWEEWQGEPITDFSGNLTGLTVFRTDAVDLWVSEEGVISQIGVHGPYRGKLFERIELGMTIDDIERLVGPCAQDVEDNLSIYGIRGLAFDVEWRPNYFIAEDLDFQLPALRFSPLTRFFVFDELEANPWSQVNSTRDPG
jgi:hypothetical protein